MAVTPGAGSGKAANVQCVTGLSPVKKTQFLASPVWVNEGLREGVQQNETAAQEGVTFSPDWRHGSVGKSVPQSQIN